MSVYPDFKAYRDLFYADPGNVDPFTVEIVTKESRATATAVLGAGRW
jgi:hypothetical protein